MDITPIVPIETHELSSPFAAQPANPGGGAFVQVIRNFLQDVNEEHLGADQAVQQLVTGETDNIHEVMLKLAQADLSFRVAMEVRDRMVQSYQEVSRMQL